ncbi:MAG: CorA family divalent cation transporter [Chloroflexota bacterium]
MIIISTIFLPLSFLAGVYGMNFDYVPILHWRYGFTALWAVFGLVVLGMLWFFKRRGWF